MFESGADYRHNQLSGNPFYYPWAPDSTRIPTLHLGHEADRNDITGYRQESGLPQLFDQADDSIVRITTRREVNGAPDAYTRGSGFFVQPDGTLATAYHVVKNNDGLWVETKDGRTYKAVISSCDPATDLATLKLTNTGQDEYFRPLKLSNRQQFYAGETTIALGHPHGWNKVFMSLGTLQAERKLSQLPINGGLMPGEDPNRSLLETRIHVEQGNSGGPVLDKYGEVIGIVDMTQGGVVAESAPVRDLYRLLNQNRYQPQPSSLANDWRWLPRSNAMHYNPDKPNEWRQLLETLNWLM